MKNSIALMALTLLTLPMIASADEGSYKALKNSIGYTFEGANSAGTSCAAVVDEGGVYLNFDGTDLTYPLSMPWHLLSKGWFSSNVVYREKDSLVCKILTPNHCERSLEGQIEIQTDSKGFLTEITYIDSNKQVVTFCKF